MIHPFIISMFCFSNSSSGKGLVTMVNYYLNEAAEQTLYEGTGKHFVGNLLDAVEGL